VLYATVHHVLSIADGVYKQIGF